MEAVDLRGVPRKRDGLPWVALIDADLDAGLNAGWDAGTGLSTNAGLKEGLNAGLNAGLGVGWDKVGLAKELGVDLGVVDSFCRFGVLDSFAVVDGAFNRADGGVDGAMAGPIVSSLIDSVADISVAISKSESESLESGILRSASHLG